MGIEYGMRAVSELAKTQKNLEYKIIGDGPLLEFLQALNIKLMTENIIALVGWKEQQEIIAILNAAHILLVPSVTSEDGDQEGIPACIAEFLNWYRMERVDIWYRSVMLRPLLIKLLVLLRSQINGQF